MHTLEQLRLGKLKGVKRLKMSCELKVFPSEITTLADSLEVLDLSGNRLKELPEKISLLKNLKIAFFSNNHFEEFPKILSRCESLEMIGFKANQIGLIPENSLPPNLRWLILTDNNIEAIPKSIGKCLRLQKVMFAGNKISQLPEEMATCKNIELLRISANNLKGIPSWLFALPKLSWLAFAGNPCCVQTSQEYPIPEIFWEELIIEEKLGEGASGVISKALWKRPSKESTRSVAVKEFKGEVTSDGFPHNEMEATIAGAGHANLVKVIGRIANHPSNKEGLVFDLIPSTYLNLAGPPDFQSCTRDTFPDNPVFPLRDILKILSGTASATAYLHKAGIMHGDLYAHNILINNEANPLFGDFGAATIYDRNDTATSDLIERIEVRAFGCLVEDLLNHVDLWETNREEFKRLIELKELCMNDYVARRPDFEAICAMLTHISTVN